MTATQRFIENAIKGGWFSEVFKRHKQPVTAEQNKRQPQSYFIGGQGFFDLQQSVNKYRILLDPLAWQAVGKTRGWKLDGDDWLVRPSEHLPEHCATAIYNRNTPSYWFNLFMQHVWDGKTIDEALSAIE